MNILLINTNPVVSRLLSLCARDNHTVLEEVSEISEVALERYDIVFVDDASCVGNVMELLENLTSEKKVLFLGNNSFEDLAEDFDEVIKKPFLPSQVTAVLENFSEEVTLDAEEDMHFIFPLSSDNHKEEEPVVEEEIEKSEEKESVEESAQMVLDGSEIERIKALLEEDDEEVLEIEDDEDYEAKKVEVIKEHLEEEGLEIIEEDQIADILNEQIELEKKPKAKKNKKSQKQKKKKEKKEHHNEELHKIFEEKLLAAAREMKPKKIKKLLKGAEVKIKINFKDEN